MAKLMARMFPSILRFGLWLNGVTGREADAIIYHEQTGKLRGLD